MEKIEINKQALEDFFNAFVSLNTDPTEFPRAIWSEKTVTECAGIDFHVQRLITKSIEDLIQSKEEYLAQEKLKQKILTGMDGIDNILEGGIHKDNLGMLIGDASCNDECYKKLLDSIKEEHLDPEIRTDVKTTIVRRKNLKSGLKDMPFEHIEWADFKFTGEHHFFDKQELVMFIDDDGGTKILKNRWGNKGEVR